MPILPAPLRAYIGLVATAVETAQGLIQRAPELPVEAVGNTMQLSMKVQQRYQELVARGDELLGHLIGPPAKPPGWATFDEDESAGGADVASTTSGISAPTSTVGGDDLDIDDDALSASPPAAFSVDSAGETTVDTSAAAVFDDDPAGGPLFDNASPAAVFDDDPVPAAVFDDEVDSSPMVTHGDPLLAETPVLTLPTKKPGRRTTGAARRRLPTLPPAVLTASPAGDDSADADELTGPSNPAPADVATVAAIPVEAVMAELADATPAAPVPPARKTAARRPAPARRPSRPRPESGTSDKGQPPTDPAVAQPAEPATGASDADAAPMS